MSRARPPSPVTAKRFAPPAVHLATVRGRARADRGSLLLAGAVVALATLLAAAVPALRTAVADRAVADAVRRAGPDARIVVQAPFERDDEIDGSRRRTPDSALVVRRSVDVARYRLGRELGSAVRAPVAAVTSAVLEVSDSANTGHTLQLAYVAGPAEPRVVWTAGRAPAASRPAPGAGRLDGPPWPVEIGLSEADAAALRAGPGDRLDVKDAQRRVVDVRVSGVFRPVDAGDPVWTGADGLLRPVPGLDGAAIDRTAGLLSAASLPDARLAVQPEQVRPTVVFTPDPDRLTWRASTALAATVVALKGASGGYDTTALVWNTRLDLVLGDVRGRIAAAGAQASVLLVGVLVTAVLVLLLAADLLVRRRVGVLAQARVRGAALAGLGVELLAESLPVALTGAGLGLLAALAVAGDVAWSGPAGPLPVVAVAVLAGPLLGMSAAARATAARRVPANRSARRSIRVTAGLRRLALEVAVLLAAAGATAALRQRGVLPAGVGDLGGPDAGGAGGGGGDLLATAAPTLAAVAGGVLLLRLLPFATALSLRRAARSRRPLALLGAARAAATAARPLPLLVLVLSGALTGFALTLSATAAAGQEDGSWRSVVGDARLRVAAPDAGAPAGSPGPVAALAVRIAAAPGVRAAVPARVAEGVPVAAVGGGAAARLVAADPVALARLLAVTPAPDAPQLARLGRPVAGLAPALLRSGDPVLRGAREVTLRWQGRSVRLAVVGTAPAIGDGEGAVLVVDAAALAAAAAPAPPDTVWVVGPGAAAATAAVATGAGAGRVDLRARALAERRADPLAAGLGRLTGAAAGVLVLLGVLGALLGAAAGAPARAETAARLRTLGLRRRDTRVVAAAELLPPVLAGVVGGLVLGVLLARAELGLLGLRLLTGQSLDPRPVVPWPALALVVLLFGAAVGAVVRLEGASRRRAGLGEALRAG